jgi:hypothetical protein
MPNLLVFMLLKYSLSVSPFVLLFVVFRLGQDEESKYAACSRWCCSWMNERQNDLLPTNY